MTNTNGDAIPAFNGSPDYLREIARQDLGETDDVKRRALQELRELIAGEPSLYCGADDAFLIMFLRARKYDTLGAFKNMKHLFETKRDNPELFDDLDPYHIPFDTACRKHRLLTVSRGTDPEGRIAVLLRLGAWNTEICSLNDFFRVGVLSCLHHNRTEEAQIKGNVIVLDMKGLGAHHVLHYTPSAIRTFIRVVQDSIPTRIKGVYVINHPHIFAVLFAAAKHFLKSKLVKRIRLLGYDVEKLHGLVPKDLIPEKYGGTLESYDYDEEEKELKAGQKFFEELSSYGYQKTTMNAT